MNEEAKIWTFSQKFAGEPNHRDLVKFYANDEKTLFLIVNRLGNGFYFRKLECALAYFIKITLYGTIVGQGKVLEKLVMEDYSAEQYFEDEKYDDERMADCKKVILDSEEESIIAYYEEAKNVI